MRHLLLGLAFVLVSAGPVLAQTLLTNAPPEAKLWEVLCKAGFPLLMTAAGPFVTSFIVQANPLLKYVLAGVASMLVGALAGQIDGFPLTSESAATMGVTLGPAGQALVNGWMKK